MRYRKWTDEETGQLLELMKTHGRNFKVIGHLLKRSPQSCEHRWRLTLLTPEQVQERTALDRIRQAAMRAKYMARQGQVPEKVEVPDDVLAERNIRLSAPRTTSAIVLGDPPIGFSALDRKRAEVRA
jgi:hypothetical protein